jgi:hypothetical protein
MNPVTEKIKAVCAGKNITAEDLLTSSLKKVRFYN